MSKTHETISGHRIEYDDPDAKLKRFLRRVQDLVDNPKASEDDLIALVYGKDNPILDHQIFPTRGAVTRETLENPVYHVLTDLLARKRVALGKLEIQQLARRYTLTVPEAAEALGITQDAVRRAIRERRLPSWVKEGAYHLDPSTFGLLGQVGRRGPVRGDTAPLECVAGYDRESKAFLRVKTDREEVPEPGPEKMESRTLNRWRRAAVLTGGHGKLRMFLIEPADEVEEVRFHEFSVRGKFRISSKINSAQKAQAAWDGFASGRS